MKVADGKNKQVLDIDESLYSEDDEMQYIVDRLKTALSDSKVRHYMNVEDEYYSAIESRDTTILLKDKQIAEQYATIKENEETIKKNEETIKEQELLLCNTVKMLQNAGMTLDQIAANLDVDINVIKNLVNQ